MLFFFEFFGFLTKVSITVCSPEQLFLHALLKYVHNPNLRAAFFFLFSTIFIEGCSGLNLHSLSTAGIRNYVVCDLFVTI